MTSDRLSSLFALAGIAETVAIIASVLVLAVVAVVLIGAGHP